MRRISYFFLLLGIVLTTSCSNKSTDRKISSIDSTIQAKATEALKEELNSILGSSGHVIVMDVHTGQIKSLVSLTRKDSVTFEENKDYNKMRFSGLFRTISLLSVLESGNVSMDDITDTDKGILGLEDGDTIKDYNWHRGGFGKISVLSGQVFSSDVSTVLSLKKAFPNENDYYAALEKMSVNKPDSIPGIGKAENTQEDAVTYSYYRDAIGFHKCTSLQTIAIYNAIANNGAMVQPQIYEDSTIVINPSIASKENIENLQQALRQSVIDGTAMKSASDKTSNTGSTGTMTLNNESYILDFCGYFPAENPQYTILVSLNKNGTPASGGAMAGNVFKVVMENIINTCTEK